MSPYQFSTVPVTKVAALGPPVIDFQLKLLPVLLTILFKSALNFPQFITL
jgi:hypothetical protein